MSSHKFMQQFNYCVLVWKYFWTSLKWYDCTIISSHRYMQQAHFCVFIWKYIWTIYLILKTLIFHIFWKYNNLNYWCNMLFSFISHICISCERKFWFPVFVWRLNYWTYSENRPILTTYRYFVVDVLFLLFFSYRVVICDINSEDI